LATANFGREAAKAAERSEAFAEDDGNAFAHFRSNPALSAIFGPI
jgi:hypothetical protein